MKGFRRNIVFKTYDVAHYLSEEQIEQLAIIEYTIDQERELEGKKPFKFIVFDGELLSIISQKLKKLFSFINIAKTMQ